MILHLVVFTWREGTTADDVARLEAALRLMPDLVPQLAQYHVGADLGLRGNADFGVAAVLAQDDLAAYLDHPEHVRIGRELIGPILGTRSAVQIPYAG